MNKEFTMISKVAVIVLLYFSQASSTYPS